MEYVIIVGRKVKWRLWVITFELEADFQTLDELLLDLGLEVGVVRGQAGEHAEDELLELGAREARRRVAQRLRVIERRVRDQGAQRLGQKVNVGAVARQHQRFVAQNLIRFEKKRNNKLPLNKILVGKNW